MKTFRLLCILFLTATALTGVCDAQTVDFWFGDISGSPVTSVDVAQGSTFDVSIWYQTSDAWTHNALELLVGFDRTTSIGTGAIPLDGEISLVSASNISFPIVLANNVGGGYSGSVGDRPYGARLAVGAALGTTVTAASPVRIADVSLTNDAIPGSDYYDVTIWDAAADSRWTSFLAMMSGINRDASAAVLRVNSTGGAVKPIVGANNRAVLNAIMTDAAGDYTWVLWGQVSNRTADTFDIDDGSGVIVHVSGTNTVADGDYVSVKGTLDVGTTTLTSQEITKHSP